MQLVYGVSSNERTKYDHLFAVVRTLTIACIQYLSTNKYISLRIQSQDRYTY